MGTNKRPERTRPPTVHGSEAGQRVRFGDIPFATRHHATRLPTRAMQRPNCRFGARPLRKAWSARCSRRFMCEGARQRRSAMAMCLPRCGRPASSTSAHDFPSELAQLHAFQLRVLPIQLREPLGRHCGAKGRVLGLRYHATLGHAGTDLSSV